MRATVVIAAALVLPGCVARTGEQMRERAPALVADSDKPIGVIGPCLVEATDNIGIPTYTPSEHGARLTVQVAGMFGDKATLVAADIEDRGERRHVTVWLFKTMWKGVNRNRVRKVQACL